MINFSSECVHNGIKTLKVSECYLESELSTAINHDSKMEYSHRYDCFTIVAPRIAGVGPSPLWPPAKNMPLRENPVNLS